MNKLLRVASWNIAGARRIKSFERFDYSGEDTAYFADSLRSIDPDVVCLQEVHINDECSTASEIAKLLNLPYIYEVTVSPSHIDDSFSLGNAILSKYELTHLADMQYPYPDFDLYFKDGKPAACHHKMVQIYSLEGLTIANTQMLPLGVFSESYAEGRGKKLASLIDDLLSEKLSMPLIFCGDFNFNTPESIYPNTYSSLKLKEALPDNLTRPNKDAVKLTPDHILVSRDLKVVEADVVKTQTDHYLCYADIQINE